MESKIEQIIITDEKYNGSQLYLICIYYSNALNYLDKEDIINLSLCSKKTYSFIEENNLLISNILYKEHSM
jgi:hypothetical protein